MLIWDDRIDLIPLQQDSPYFLIYSPALPRFTLTHLSSPLAYLSQLIKELCSPFRTETDFVQVIILDKQPADLFTHIIFILVFILIIPACIMIVPVFIAITRIIFILVFILTALAYVMRQASTDFPETIASSIKIGGIRAYQKDISHALGCLLRRICGDYSKWMT